MELLAPAGSPEALVAAVQGGADAVYLGFGPLNARRLIGTSLVLRTSTVTAID